MNRALMVCWMQNKLNNLCFASRDAGTPLLSCYCSVARITRRGTRCLPVAGQGLGWPLSHPTLRDIQLPSAFYPLTRMIGVLVCFSFLICQSAMCAEPASNGTCKPEGPIELFILLDISGSMHGKKLSSCVDFMRTKVAELDAASVSIVAFDTDWANVFPTSLISQYPDLSSHLLRRSW